MSYKQANSPYIIYQPISSPSSKLLFFKSYDQLLSPRSTTMPCPALPCIALRRTTQ